VNIYEALYTTRSMRRLSQDPIPYEVQARILDAAIRAPSGGNRQLWRFLLVDDPALKEELAVLYRASMEALWAGAYAERIANADAAAPVGAEILRLVGSAQHLADHWQEVPLFLFGFAGADAGGSSIYPALWSAMLAARAEGVGSTLTTVLGVYRAAETLALLGVPADGGWTMAGCVALGYPTGRWSIAPRRPVHEVAARNRWDGPLGFEVPAPLWPELEAQTPS
jgi:nitroreductase